MKHQIVLSVVALACLLTVAQAEIVEKPATVIFNDQMTKLDAALIDGTNLWVAFDDVQKVNGFEAKPQGLCAGDICIPIPAQEGWTSQRGDKKYLNVSRFATKMDQAVASDTAGDVWSFGVVPDAQNQLLPKGIAPDFALSDRSGKTVKLSDFRGKKVLILTWASW